MGSIQEEFYKGIFDSIKADMFKLIGFHKDFVADDPTGTAIETIEQCAIICPDVMNNPFIQTNYNTVSDVSIELFLTLSIGMAIMFLLNHFDSSNYATYAAFISIFKNSIIFLFGIHSCLYLFQMAIYLNYDLSMAFGGMSYVKDMLMNSGIMEMGLFASGVGIFAIFIMACFYICRALILALSPFLIAFALVLWLISKCGWVFEGWCDNLSKFIARFVITNLFLGCIMVLVFGIATWFFKRADSMDPIEWGIGGWGMEMLGSIVLIGITFIPFLAIALVIWNPVPTVKKIIL